jgi:hypothetical protein
VTVENKKFVVASFEIDCADNRPPPIYRIWLDAQDGYHIVSTELDNQKTFLDSESTRIKDNVPKIGRHLFAERCFDFGELWLQESLQILAPPGEYVLRVECLNKNINQLRLWNFHVDKGPAVFHPRENHNSPEILLEIQ